MKLVLGLLLLFAYPFFAIYDAYKMGGGRGDKRTKAQIAADQRKQKKQSDITHHYQIIIMKERKKPFLKKGWYCVKKGWKEDLGDDVYQIIDMGNAIKWDEVIPNKAIGVRIAHGIGFKDQLSFIQIKSLMTGETEVVCDHDLQRYWIDTGETESLAEFRDSKRKRERGIAIECYRAGGKYISEWDLNDAEMHHSWLS